MGESRDHFYRAGMEFLMALRTFGEGWLALLQSDSQRSGSWTESLRTILNELSHLTAAYAKSAPSGSGAKAVQKLIEALDAEIESIVPPMDEHKRAYRDALLGVKRVLEQTLAQPAGESRTPPGSSFRPVRVE